ncbi:nucleoside hydrolase [Candidatus Aquiluna sp. UB-MaderosW2red]|uniref:nucleoside hydrolase n=1 Tax=Candidatus Aquiluna sp. UB-MaderosW2red TaxID=1855377 RepID=UPI000875D10D|nr:nucleoside hydrolase [Candidatus Aquiluna sp. UB-MaderosW2red]SCX10720.1 purine nucleosidase/pyrimidine-specific ribonucleoside hydrolase [Candidatus Aquiluna sp. UB-MaderosW2red]
MPTSIILDCDPGHDDAVAILLAVSSPEIDLKAVTTCFGNCSIEDATRNALRILTLAGATSVPVAQGAGVPLKQSLELGNYVHGASGLDGPEMPEPGMKLSELSAVELMHRILEESDTAITVVVTGPMTNMAQLLRDYPNSLEKITEVIFMGGSTERGNHTPSAEFNTFADPEALDEVIKSGVPLRMVGLNLTHQALAVPSVVERMQAMNHVIGKTCAEWMGFFGSSYRSVWSFEAPPVHDPCTIAALIDPTLIQWQSTFLAVELDGKWSRGETIVDLHNRYELQANASVAIKLDSKRYWDLVLESIERLGRSQS